MRVYVLMLMAGLSLCVSLSACGRRGNPSPPGPPADIIYPHPSPAQ
jgi:predicted small lipoprotein YifL